MDAYERRDAIGVLELAIERAEKRGVSKGASSCILTHVASAHRTLRKEQMMWPEAGKMYFPQENLAGINDSIRTPQKRKEWAVSRLKDRIAELRKAKT